MPIPLTFSAPRSAYSPSVEDALSFGVWLMLRADDANRKKYSYDDEDEAAGVRIMLQKAMVERGDQSIVCPQQIVAVAFNEVRFDDETSLMGKRTIVIAVTLLEAYDTAYADPEELIGAPASPTVLAKMARVDEILQLGTLYQQGDTYNRGAVVDPFRTPLYDDDDAPSQDLIGAYNPTSGVILLNDQPPTLSRAAADIWPRRFVKKVEDVNPLTDLAVAYSVLAKYEVRIPDRRTMTRGGSNA